MTTINEGDVGSTGLTSDEQPDGRFAQSLRAVGSRVRGERRRSGLSLRDLATRSGLSSSFLSLVERGECSLSLTSLFAISEALDITPHDLLDASTADDAELQEYSVWRSPTAEGSPTVQIGEREYFRFRPGFADQALDPLFFRIHPTSTIAPLTSHDGEEVAYVVRGALWLQLGDQEITIGEGDGIHFPSSVPHTIANRTDAVTEAFWISTSIGADAHHRRDA